MAKKLKIVTIGGGSSYTPELIEGFIKRYDELPISELWLVDIKDGEKKLEIVGNLAKRMVKKAGVPMKIYLTLNRRKAFKDADFVTTQFRVGLLDARIKDERIPISHGLIGQETNGAGGMFKGLRTIPVIFDIIKDMEELCPDAWLINFTNPAGMITEAVYRHTNFKKFVGLCNVPIGTHLTLSKWLKVDPKDVTMKIVGLNHHFFVTDVYLKGNSVMDKVIKFYENIKPEEFETMKNIMAFPWSASLIRGIKAIPCAYLSYYFFTQEQLDHQKKDYKKHKVRAEFVREVEKKLFEMYKDPLLCIKPKELEKRGGAHYSDAACSCINSIYNNKGDIQYVNTRNLGALRDFDDNTAIEAACIMTSDGPKPIAMGEIPYELKGTIMNIKTFERLCAEAAITGNRDKAIAALNMNPLITSDKLANEVFDELYYAHKKYLPQFEKTMRKKGKK